MNNFSILSFFAKHKTAANLLMVFLIVFGLLSLERLNRQLFPDLDIEIIVISTIWPGASAEDVDKNIIQKLVPDLRPLSGVKKVKSTSSENLAVLQIEYDFGTNMQNALSDVEAVVNDTDLPEDSEKPRVFKAEFKDEVTNIVLSGPFSIQSLRSQAKIIKEDLLALGVDKIDIAPNPSEEILIEISETELARLNLSMNDISRIISSSSVDVPAGSFADGALRVRSLGLKEIGKDYAQIEIIVKPDGTRILLGDIAKISETFSDPMVEAYRNGENAINLKVLRSKTNDALKVNETVQNYLIEQKNNFPKSLNVEQFGTVANLISDRINLLTRNATSGLIIVLIVLFVFLTSRTAFWVALGIPVAFAATFGVMLLTGQTINMISLFGLIMALGIVVDDAIVVGEHSEHLEENRGMDASQSSILAATRMSPPVISAMLTTVAAFLPLFFIKGIIGQIIFAIPAVVCAVLAASLLEVFLIMPAHLRHGVHPIISNIFSPFVWLLDKIQKPFNRGFNWFKEKIFKKLVTISYNWRYATISSALALLIFSVGMVSSGRVPFAFFSGPEGDIVFANITMTSGSSRSQTSKMLNEMERALKQTELELVGEEGKLVLMSFNLLGFGSANNTEENDAFGASYDRASVTVELITADKRDVRVEELITTWKKNINPVPGLEKISIRAPVGGPPGRDIDIRITGDDLNLMKQASDKVMDLVKTLPGSSDVTSNLNYGAEEIHIELTPKGKSLGFSTFEIGVQVRSALEGAIVRRFARGDEEVTVRIKLPSDEIENDNLAQLKLIAPNGSLIRLEEVASLKNNLGFSVIRRTDGSREVKITGDLDETLLNTSGAKEKLEELGIKNIISSYGLNYRYSGRDEEQQEAFADMRIGGTIGLLSIYIVLAWVFASWLRPLAVMIMIPFGFIGAVAGHYILGLTMSILSMFAIIALAGIVVNNSIILVATIERRLAENQDRPAEAIISGVCDRLRPVILTSCTTIGGLSALMFETSLQAQYLIPMAATITFGLGVTTLLVLFVIPSTLGIGSDISRIFSRIFSNFSRV